MAAIMSDTSMVKEQEIDVEFLDHLNKTLNNIVKCNEYHQVQEIEINETELENLVQKHKLENDKQTKCFTKFLSTIKNLSSKNLTRRLSRVPKVVQNVTDLLDMMRREVEEFADIADQFEELINTFGKLVMNTQQTMDWILPCMFEAKGHLSSLTEIFNSDRRALTSMDQNDIKIPMNGLLKSMKKMIDLSHNDGEESRQLAGRITKLKTDVEKQRITVHGRIHLSKALSCLGPLAGAGIVARTVGILIAAKELGGPGVLIVAGASLNPIAAIICGAILGGTLLITIAGLIYRFWTRHQYKALAFLEKICVGLMELANVNVFLLDYLNRCEEAANTISTQIEQLQCSFNSERYRKKNEKLCKKSIETIEKTVQVIESIQSMNISQWLNPQTVPRFDIQTLALPAAISQ